MAGTLKDLIGGKDIEVKENGQLVIDRFGNPNSGN